jgi:hypothetical protein
MPLLRLEVENGQLKKIATDLSLENEMLRRKSAVIALREACAPNRVTTLMPSTTRRSRRARKI